MLGHIYGFVSCWHCAHGLKMAKRALVDDECVVRMMIQGTELSYSAASQQQARSRLAHSLKQEILDSAVAQGHM